jgi:hypothetical protein
MTEGESEPARVEGAVVQGLRMPPSRFMWVLLHYYKVELRHLAPNSVS